MNKLNRSVSFPLADYIHEFYGGSQRAFAAVQGVKPQQVTQWISKGFVVINHTLYSPRRELNDPN